MTTTQEERLAAALAERDHEARLIDLDRYLSEAETAIGKAARIIAEMRGEATR